MNLSLPIVNSQAFGPYVERTFCRNAVSADCKEFWNFLGEDEDVRRTVFLNNVKGKREQSTATIGMTSQKFEF